MMVLESPILTRRRACRRSTCRATCEQPALTLRPGARRLSRVAVQRSEAPRHGEGQRRPARAARRRAAASISRRDSGASADSAPYLHDGRAPSFDYAIAGHDGEGAAARAAFNGAPLRRQGAAARLPDVLATRAARGRALIAPRLARRSTYRSSTPTPSWPSTGWRSEPISSAGRPCPSGSGARRMCHPNQQSASSPNSSARTAPLRPERSSTRPTFVVRRRDDTRARRWRRRPRRRRRDRRRDHHPCVLLARLTSRPVPQLLARAPE